MGGILDASPALGLRVSDDDDDDDDEYLRLDPVSGVTVGDPPTYAPMSSGLAFGNCPCYRFPCCLVAGGR